MEELDSLIVTLQTTHFPTTRRHEAFGELVRRFQDMAYGYALGMLGDSDLAEDVAQEAFLTAYQKLGQLREPKAFPGWLRRIVFTQCNRVTRRRHVSLQSFENMADLPSGYPGPPAVIESEELKEQVLAAIQTLPEQQRLAVVLVYIDGYSQKEVAEFLEIPVTALKKRLQRARSHLRERMLDMVRDNLHESRPSNDERFVQALQLSLALESVALESQLSLLELLLVDGVNVNVPDANGQTPLHWAAQNGHLEAVELLLKNGADPTSRDRSGNTPLQLALHNHHQAVVDCLRHYDGSSGH
jgi:RNA polymerase sigma factor (sigma-70 family)